MKHGEIALEVEQIVKNYGTHRAVDNLTFEVKGGEIFAMLGPNGAGKSTTIRMILDIIKPDNGSIRIMGNKMSDRVKDRIGYMPEERGLYRNVKVLDIMTYLGMLKGMSNRDAKQGAMAYLKRVELDDYANKKVSELSKGMQQKVQFGVTILHKPELIIIDEVFAGLDPVNTLLIKEIVRELRDEGRAIIMSTHQMQQIEEMADRLLMINHGKQALYGDVEQVRRNYALHAVVVTGSGDWSQLQGVSNIETRGSGQQIEHILYMKDNVTSNDLLAELAQAKDVNVESYELAVPGLNDIFIRVARGMDVNGNGVSQVEAMKQGQLA